MLDVSSMLKIDTAALTIPKKPAFSTRSDEDEDRKSTLQLEIHSVNDATVSEVVAR